MARLLMNLILMQHGFPPVIIHVANKHAYLLALEQADADDDLEPFVTLVGNALLKSLTLYLRGAQGERIEQTADLDEQTERLKQRMKGE
jgi:Fic family protein